MIQRGPPQSIPKRSSLIEAYSELNRKILSWKFFLNRFDALYLEAQLALQRSGDIFEIRDLKNSHVSSDAFNKKLQVAREAVKRYAPAGSPSVQPRSLMRSLSTTARNPIHRKSSFTSSNKPDKVRLSAVLAELIVRFSRCCRSSRIKYSVGRVRRRS